MTCFCFYFIPLLLQMLLLHHQVSSPPLRFQKNHFLYSGKEYVGACNAKKPVFPICHFWALLLLTQVQSRPMPFFFMLLVLFFGFCFVILCCIRVCYLFYSTVTT